MALKRPDWDPRGNSKKLIFRSGIIKADDLKLEMQLEGQVVNVVDFGVFVDIGLGESSLVHVSRASPREIDGGSAGKQSSPQTSPQVRRQQGWRQTGSEIRLGEPDWQVWRRA